MHKDMDGTVLKVGDGVGFKNGVEQYGKIVEIAPSGMIKVQMYDSNTGENYTITESAKRCWKE